MLPNKLKTPYSDQFDLGIRKQFGQIQTYFDRGLYDEADVVLSSLERSNPDFDGGRFGLKRRFESLKLAVVQKVPKKAAPPPEKPKKPQ